MATGNGEAPDGNGTRQCGVSDFSPKCEDPNTSPVVATESGPCEGSSRAAPGFRTYKRRKRLVKSSSTTRSRREVTANTEGMAQLETQATDKLQDRASQGTMFEQAHDSTLPCYGAANDNSDSSRGQWCKVVLEQIDQSLNEGGGLLGCIRKAIQHSTDTDNTKIKESVFGIEGRPRHAAQAEWMCNGAAVKEAGCRWNSSSEGICQQSISDMCQHAFYDVVISGKFNLLCKLLSENFQESKIDHLLDFGLINSRMKEGIYERSPACFYSDFEQVWRKLEVIGTELASLAKNLVDLSRISCNEHVGKAIRCTSNGENDKVNLQDPLCDTKLEQTEDWSMFRVCTCRRCGERAHGRECLICDSCEDMFHVSCIEPPVEEIPLQFWYCAQCVSDGKRSTHENCIVCKRLYSSKTAFTGVSEKVTGSNTTKDLTDSGDDNSARSFRNSFGICSICGSDMFIDEIIRECSHSLCPHGNYHERCLTVKQLKSYGPCWYCPSCLCRTCLSDQDDDKIILCDACDHAYHIYCVKPPLSKIPAGKWFCTKCETGLQAILRVKRACEGVNVKAKRGRKKLKERVVSRGRKKRIKEEPDKVGGGMDMLLNAAKTLNLEENLAAVKKG